MKRGRWRALVFTMLLGSTIVYAGFPSTPSPHQDTRTMLLESAGGLGCGIGLAALALPFTLAYYLFSPGDVATVLTAEGACLGLGSAAGACWTGRGINRTTRFWPALGLAVLPEIGAGLAMGLTRKGPDLTDPLVAACCWMAVIASPVLATVGANLGSKSPGSVTESRLSVSPQVRSLSGQGSGYVLGQAHYATAVGLRFQLNF